MRKDLRNWTEGYGSACCHGFPLSLPLDCSYGTPRTTIYETSKGLCFHKETKTTRDASVDEKFDGYRKVTPKHI